MELSSTFCIYKQAEEDNIDKAQTQDTRAESGIGRLQSRKQVLFFFFFLFFLCLDTRRSMPQSSYAMPRQD